MVLTVFLHMVRVFYHGAYKPPREFNWVVGVVLLFLTLGLSFTGYLLPWDQIAFWAITVGTQMAAYAPVLGSETGFFLLGGIEVGLEHAAPLLRLPRHLPAAHRRALHDRPLLEDPEGRRHQRSGVRSRQR